MTKPEPKPSEPVVLYRVCWRNKTTLEEGTTENFWSRDVALLIARAGSRYHDYWLEPVRSVEGY